MAWTCWAVNIIGLMHFTMITNLRLLISKRMTFDLTFMPINVLTLRKPGLIGDGECFGIELLCHPGAQSVEYTLITFNIRNILKAFLFLFTANLAKQEHELQIMYLLFILTFHAPVWKIFTWVAEKTTYRFGYFCLKIPMT